MLNEPRTHTDPPVERIALSFVRNKFGQIDRIRTAEFKPGMIIERMGKHYQVDAKGTQRRIQSVG